MATTNTSIRLINTEKRREAGATQILLKININEIRLNTIICPAEMFANNRIIKVSGLTNMPKKGFAIPIKNLMKHEIKDWVNDTLSKNACDKHGLFNYNIVQKIKEDHQNDISNNEFKLWSLIQFNEWYNIFFQYRFIFICNLFRMCIYIFNKTIN